MQESKTGAAFGGPVNVPPFEKGGAGGIEKRLHTSLLPPSVKGGEEERSFESPLS